MPLWLGIFTTKQGSYFRRIPQLISLLNYPTDCQQAESRIHDAASVAAEASQPFIKPGAVWLAEWLSR